MNTREAFEATCNLHPGMYAKNERGEYVSPLTEQMHGIFAAGAAWAARECVKECEAQANQRYTGGDACAGIADAIRTQFPESFTKE